MVTLPMMLTMVVIVMDTVTATIRPSTSTAPTMLFPTVTTSPVVELLVPRGNQLVEDFRKLLLLLFRECRKEVLVVLLALRCHTHGLFTAFIGEVNPHRTLIFFVLGPRNQPRLLHLAQKFAQRRRANIEFLGEHPLRHGTVMREHHEHARTASFLRTPMHQQMSAVVEATYEELIDSLARIPLEARAVSASAAGGTMVTARSASAMRAMAAVTTATAVKIAVRLARAAVVASSMRAAPTVGAATVERALRSLAGMLPSSGFLRRIFSLLRAFARDVHAQLAHRVAQRASPSATVAILFLNHAIILSHISTSQLVRYLVFKQNTPNLRNVQGT